MHSLFLPLPLSPLRPIDDRRLQDVAVEGDRRDLTLSPPSFSPFGQGDIDKEAGRKRRGLGSPSAVRLLLLSSSFPAMAPAHTATSPTRRLVPFCGALFSPLVVRGVYSRWTHRTVPDSLVPLRSGSRTAGRYSGPARPVEVPPRLPPCAMIFPPLLSAFPLTDPFNPPHPPPPKKVEIRGFDPAGAHPPFPYPPFLSLLFLVPW